MLLLLLLFGLLLSQQQSQGQQYHYNRPQVPFDAGQRHHHHQQQQQQHYYQAQPQQHAPQQHYHAPAAAPHSQAATFIVHTLGPQSRAYELQMQQSHPIYVAHQTGGYQAVPQPYQQPPPPPPQQVYQQPPVPQAYQQPPPPQLYQPPPPPTSSHHNPLLVHQQQLPAQQPAPFYAPPAAAPVSTAIATAGVPGYPYPPSGVPESSYAGATAVASGHAHGGLNPQPYAVVRLPNGQQQQDGGHGNGPQAHYAAAGSAAGHAVAPRIGDYNAQSQLSQLDGYNYKQTVPGDARNYQRFITSCDANGQCQQLPAQGPGQLEPPHQQLLQAVRAQTLPAADDCDVPAGPKPLPPGTELSTTGQLRPRNRRTYAYSETLVKRDPFN